MDPSSTEAHDILCLPPSPNQEPPPLIFPHQRKVFEQLLELTQIAIYTHQKCFPIRPRTSTLIIGPSGSGKSHLPRTLANTLNLPIYALSVSEWVLMGCSGRGAEVTWPQIVEFLRKNRSADGVIIAIDEIDKLSRRTSWEVFLITEVFSLLDLRIPDNLRDADGCNFTSSGLSAAHDVLKTRTMIIGMGAFQEMWDARQVESIGFRSDSPNLEMPTLRAISDLIPGELANRFRSEVLLLPPLQESDYHAMLEVCSEGVPGNFRERFLEMGRSAVREAVHNRKGPRFLEELLADLLIAERKEIRKPTLEGQKSTNEPEAP